MDDNTCPAFALFDWVSGSFLDCISRNFYEE